MLDHLKNKKLFTEKVYLNGSWVGINDTDKKEGILVTNPANGQKIGSVPSLNKTEVSQVINQAENAFQSWKLKTAKERAAILKRFYDLIIENKKDLALLMTLEQGKPIAESEGEIVYAASFIEWFAEEGKRIYGDIIPTHDVQRRILVLKQPIGVVAAITPWNFPSAMITRKCGPALAAGCSIIIKPAAETPYSALALAVLAEEAGIPAGVFNVVTGSAKEIGEEFTTNPKVRKISFTGSTEIGKLLQKQSADTLKKLSLELGGHAPFIVFDDADIEAAVQGAMLSKYRNSGQTCVCTNRFYVHDSVYDEFVSQFTAAVQGLKVGSGFDSGVEQGPLINNEAVEKVEEHVADAKSKGGDVVVGGKKHDLGGLFFEPTVVTNVTNNMQMAKEETFGPVAPIIRFTDEKEVISLANDSIYGLAAYFYGQNMPRIWRVAEALEYGIVGVNVGIISTEVAPFGGVKQSGMGREGSKYGIEDYLEIKYLCMGGITE